MNEVEGEAVVVEGDEAADVDAVVPNPRQAISFSFNDQAPLPVKNGWAGELVGRKLFCFNDQNDVSPFSVGQ